MKTQLMLCTAFLAISAHAFAHMPAEAQTPRTSGTPRTPTTAVTPQTPAPTAAPPAAPTAPAPPAPSLAPPPPPPAPPGPPRREGQPINVRVELNISEEGGNAPPVRKSVSAVAGDGFSGYVREVATPIGAPNTLPAPPVSLNFDAYPVILTSGKVRLTCTIQYVAGQTAAPGEGRTRTDIRQNLVLNLESGKSLVISQATDPISDRRVTVEVTATILR